MSRPLCARCARPLRTCLCHWVRATPNRVRVLLLQHPQEAHEAKGSATLLRLSLAQVQVQVGEVWAPAVLRGWLRGPGRKRLALPGDTAHSHRRNTVPHGRPAATRGA